MSAHDSYNDVDLWESIRAIVEKETEKLIGTVENEISNDNTLKQYQSQKPVSYQLSRIMEHRADGWVRREYDICCEALGQPISPKFDRGMWTFAIEPFINTHLYDLLLRTLGFRFPPSLSAVRAQLVPTFGRPRPEERVAAIAINSQLQSTSSEIDDRPLQRVDQRKCCEYVQGVVRNRWWNKLSMGRTEDPEEAGAVRAMAQYLQTEQTAARMVRGLPPVETRISVSPEALECAAKAQVELGTQCAAARQPSQSTQPLVNPPSASETPHATLTRVPPEPPADQRSTAAPQVPHQDDLKAPAIESEREAIAAAPESEMAIDSTTSAPMRTVIGIGHKGGRPRKDDERKKILELKDKGKSWAEITRQMNRETGQTKSKDAYRRLVGPHLKKALKSPIYGQNPGQN